MGLRFKFLSAVFAVLVLVAHNTDMRVYDSVNDVFVGLAILLVFSIVALWPNTQRSDRVDRSMAGSNWSDRIVFDKDDRDGRGGGL